MDDLYSCDPTGEVTAGENTIPEDFEVFECKEVGKVPKCFHNNRDSPEMECRCGNFIE